MVDFAKKLGRVSGSRVVDPLLIYEGLDRSSDKGPLRPAQSSILREWHSERRSAQDVIVKLHTGQGKTLIGLLALQSKLNEGLGPALYVCPNKFLVAQTCEQARQFGVPVDVISEDIPDSFVNSKSILVVTVHSLFNGLTRFGLGARSQEVGALVFDDAHACIDVIREQVSIRLPKKENAYGELVEIFEAALRNQGAGTCADLLRGHYDAILPVPYWEWIDSSAEVAKILSRHRDSKNIKFAWPLLKDSLQECSCVVSGDSLEIVPHLPPLHHFGSFSEASHRIFMSATVTDDSFLVKGLRLDSQTIKNPLAYGQEKWSGEKMILIPSLIDEELDRGRVVELFAKPGENRRSGVVALCPSFVRTKDWGAYGAEVARAENIEEKVAGLKAGLVSRTLVVVNRYDGIDLPDNVCRILVVDSRPFSESVLDRYLERCLGSSEGISARVARKIEQGLGRSVRGEKDYCVVILIGPDLIKQIRTSASRRFFSAQTRTQIEMGLEIADDARAEGKDSVDALKELVSQCLGRDEGWKAFYAERMGAIDDDGREYKRLEIFSRELEAELRVEEGRFEDAVETVQKICDEYIFDDVESGWYLQEMARMIYRSRKTRANDYQVAAHKRNRYLLKPRSGMVFQKTSPLSQMRVDRVVDMIRGFENFEELILEVEEVVPGLAFGVEAERFESAMHRLGVLLGFACSRPDAEWKEGPDNLWCLTAGEYLLLEAKSEVRKTRAEIKKYESEQMNASVAWFRKKYPGSKSKNILIHPANRLAGPAAFIEDVEVMRESQLYLLTRNIRGFFGEFKRLDLRDVSPEHVQKCLGIHRLNVEDLWGQYSVGVRFSNSP